MLVIAIIIGLQRFLSYITETNKTIESWIEGEAVCLVRQGIIDMEKLQSEQLSKTELFDILRTQGIVHLGQVRAAYLETSGKVSVIRAQPTRAGLCILPVEDQDSVVSSWRSEPAQKCCSNCGKLFDASGPMNHCDHCGSTEQTIAIEDLNPSDSEQQATE